MTKSPIVQFTFHIKEGAKEILAEIMAVFLCEDYGNALKTVFFARKSASSQKNRTISLRGWLK